jgi:hypothetical protein
MAPPTDAHLTTWSSCPAPAPTHPLPHPHPPSHSLSPPIATSTANSCSLLDHAHLSKLSGPSILKMNPRASMGTDANVEGHGGKIALQNHPVVI